MTVKLEVYIACPKLVPFNSVKRYDSVTLKLHQYFIISWGNTDSLRVSNLKITLPGPKLFKTYDHKHVLNVLNSGVGSIPIGYFHGDVILLQLPEFL